MDFTAIKVMLSHPFTLFFDTTQRLSLIYMLTALAAAVIVYWRMRVRAGKSGIDGLVRWLIPAQVLTHPSARADYIMFLINKSVIAALYASIVIQSYVWFDLVTALLGPPEPADPSMAVTILTTVVVAMAMDAMLWWGHYMFHKIPVLWEFHKVHHSAEVMTPITAVRMHPVEELVTSIMSGIAIGVTTALLNQVFGQGAVVFNLFGVNIVLALFFLAAFNLRHSHVWLRYPFWLQHVIVSPAQHQIHHSRAMKHWDKNMGFIFGLWDWAAGTLYAPKSREEITFGLGNGEDGTWNSARTLYFRPFRNAYMLIASGWRNALFFPPKTKRPREAAQMKDQTNEQRQTL